MQTALSFDDGEPTTAYWQIRCPTCDAPPGLSCVGAGEKEPGKAGRFDYNHEARREQFRQIRREVRRRRSEQNPLIQTLQHNG